MKWIYGATAVAVLGWFLWGARDLPALRRWVPTPLPSAALPGADHTAAPGAVHKCRRGDEILYTNGPCPSGSREFAVVAGTLTVVPPLAVPAPAAASGPRSVLRALAGNGSGELQQRRLDAWTETPR